MSKIDWSVIRDFVTRIRLSKPEWFAVILTLIFAGVVVYFYLDSTQPLKNRLAELRAKEKSLQIQMIDEAEKKKSLEEQKNNSEQILDSLRSFESRLRNRTEGVTAIIDEVNQLAKAHNVKAGDISFKTETPEILQNNIGTATGASPSPSPLTRRDKLPKVYEGLGVDTTVEGDYHDLRRFIAALERSRNFIIINAITLQSIEEKERKGSGFNPALQQGIASNPGPESASGNEVTKIEVSLKIEMETHFARDNMSNSEMGNANMNVKVADAPIKK